MADKEHIMIDVNKCKYRDSYTNFCLAEKDDIGETYTICTGTDCYFKQLARETQECERSLKRISDLEERIINHSNEIEEYCSRLADKNKECEELKERLVRTEEDLKYQCVDCMNVKSDRYRKALEEIEEQCKCYGRSKYTQEFDREYGGRT